MLAIIAPDVEMPVLLISDQMHQVAVVDLLHDLGWTGPFSGVAQRKMLPSIASGEAGHERLEGGRSCELGQQHAVPKHGVPSERFAGVRGSHLVCSYHPDLLVVAATSTSPERFGGLTHRTLHPVVPPVLTDQQPQLRDRGGAGRDQVQNGAEDGNLAQLVLVDVWIRYKGRERVCSLVRVNQSLKRITSKIAKIPQLRSRGSILDPTISRPVHVAPRLPHPWPVRCAIPEVLALAPVHCGVVSVD
mmetsp:Transcript_49071/g.105109  ORF Transcript_49071/g.105109 Transcript_49071/m.105109 type:complete len:246 (-) Transcript_49071:803-1540(-)